MDQQKPKRPTRATVKDYGDNVLSEDSDERELARVGKKSVLRVCSTHQAHDYNATEMPSITYTSSVYTNAAQLCLSWNSRFCLLSHDYMGRNVQACTIPTLRELVS